MKPETFLYSPNDVIDALILLSHAAPMNTVLNLLVSRVDPKLLLQQGFPSHSPPSTQSLATGLPAKWHSITPEQPGQENSSNMLMVPVNECCSVCLWLGFPVYLICRSKIMKLTFPADIIRGGGSSPVEY